MEHQHPELGVLEYGEAYVRAYVHVNLQRDARTHLLMTEIESRDWRTVLDVVALGKKPVR